MTEKEYILVSDLKSIRHAILMLEELHAGTVPAREKALVLTTLDRWKDRLRERIDSPAIGSPARARSKTGKRERPE